jgi:hypothetical protein
MSVGDISGIHFGYSESGNALYRKSAIVFERSDSAFGDARGKVHILNAISGSASATLADAKFTIDASGNVGIGTTSPGAKLDISTNINSIVQQWQGAGTNFNLRLTSGNGATQDSASYRIALDYLNGTATNGFIDFYRGGDGVSGYLAFGTAGTEKMRVLANGNVGIGTATPNGTLTVFNSATFNIRTSGINVHRPSSYGQYGSFSYDSDTTFFGSTYTGGGANVSGAFRFVAYDSASTSFERFYIGTTGNVGIGSASPTTSLDLSRAGTSTFRMSSASGGYFTDFINAVDSSNSFRIQHNGADILHTTGDGYEAVTLGNNGYTLVTSYANTNVHIKTGGTERLRIDSSGNVGVGTTTPTSTLQVSYSNPVNVPAAGASGHALAVGTSGYGLAAGVRTNGDVYLQSTRWDGLATNYNMLLQPNGGSVGIGTTSPGTVRLRVLGPVGDWASYLSGSATTGNSYGVLIDAGTNSSDTAFRIRSYGGSDYMHVRGDGNVGIGTTSPAYKLEVVGSFAATTKSFVIDHPTKPDMKLRYGSLEGPENGVYVRGRLTSNTIELPEYWTGLVDEDTITINLTPIGKHQDLYVENISDNKITVGGENINCFYTVFAERKDVEKLEVEFDNECSV